jgi:5-methylcytosine-specific restriction endonuclease McrA
MVRKRLSRLNEREIVCGPGCRRQLNRRGVATPVPWYHPNLSTAVPLCSPLRVRECVADDCPRTFRAVYRETGYCSDACRERVARRRFIERRGYAPEDRGRYRQHAEDIFDRDGHVCQLCGGLVDFAVPILADLAPTIDHIIPQSLGGSDEPENLQTAHRACNREKGNTIGWRRATPLGSVAA